MFEVVGLLIESLVGYVGGRFSIGKISIHVSSILVGLIFFLCYFLYEIFDQKALVINSLFSLLFISFSISVLTYLFFIACIWFNNKKNSN